MPPRPSVQAPRRNLASTVSAWSSRVCAVATASHLAAWPTAAGTMRIAGAARLLQWFRRLCPLRIGPGFGSRIHARLVEWQPELAQPDRGKFQIAIRLFAAQTVVQMGRVQHQAQFPAPLGQGAQQGHRVRTAGEPDGQPQPGPQQRDVDSKIEPHQWMIGLIEDSFRRSCLYGRDRRCLCTWRIADKDRGAWYYRGILPVMFRGLGGDDGGWSHSHFDPILQGETDIVRSIVGRPPYRLSETVGTRSPAQCCMPGTM